MDRENPSSIDDIADALINGGAGQTSKRPTQLRLIDATIAGQDAMMLARVAKLIASMSPDGRRATLCWLVGYFDPQAE